MNGYLLDACALIALLNDEPGAEKVEQILSSIEQPVCMSALNLLEVAYDAVRRTGSRDAAKMILQFAEDEGIRILWIMSESEWLAAARWKARGRLSLADAVALATAEARNMRLVRADHHEFDSLVSEGLIEVMWVR